MTALYVILGVAVVALIVLTILYFRNKKKAAKAAAQEADSGLAPGGDEIAVLIHQAEAKLAAAKLGQSAKVGNLPVFLVMGEPGTTKTSVMLHSGLEPELVAGQVYQGGNVAPTRSANLWFSRRSLFVEAGGPLLGDAGKWSKLVKRLQPRASVVGKGEQAGRAAVVCFDCENFTKPGAMDIVVNAARTLRARLGEISQAMGINLPVYALFTKTDRLPYFTDYVRNLNNEEATQVLGVTLPMIVRRSEGVYAEEETARLTGQFELLFRALADGRPEFLARETDATKLPPAYEFPREFRKIRPTVVQFLVDLCRPSQLTVGPFLRGFYFAGVRPVIINEAAPVAAPAAPQQAAFSAGGAGATGIFGPRAGALAPQQAAPPPVLATRKVPQWVFLSHLFNDVLLADRAALDASGASTKVSGARRVLFIAAASLAFLLTVFFTISFFNNRSLENRVRTAARGIPASESTGADLATAGSLQKLEALRQSLQQIVTYNREGAPLFYRWGLYIGEPLYREARRVYFERFRQLLFRQTSANMLDYLRALPASNTEYRPTYMALRSYLITTSHHDKSDSQLPPVLMTFWQNGRDVDQARRDLAQKQFEFYQGELFYENPYSSDNDRDTIERARTYLKRMGGAQRVYQAMLAEANKKYPPVNFNKQYPGSDKVVLDRYDVQGAFTKDGYKFMTDAMAHPDRYIQGEAWVLGDTGAANVDMARLALEIKTLYSNDFVKEWRNYVKAASIQRYKDLQDGADKLKLLSDTQSPLLQLFGLASLNTNVDDPKAAEAFAAVRAVVPPDKQNPLTQGANQPYINALSQLQISVDGAAKQLNDTTANQTASDARNARTAMVQLSRFPADLEGHVDRQVAKLLEDPITYAENLVRAAAPAELNAGGKALCGQIHPVMSKYPFSPNATAEATLADLNSVFKPKEGALWQFVDNKLSKLVQKQGPRYAGTPAAGVQVTDQFLGWLNRAAAFTDAAYKDGSADPRLSYAIKPVLTPDVESINLTIDGQNMVFSAAASGAKPAVWPGAAHGVQMNVKFGGQSFIYPTYDGLWAVFHWVADADKVTGTAIEMTLRSGKQGRAVLNPANNQPITVRFDIQANPMIFERGYFAQFGCVANVAK
jgi:type VI secretion system protein ImpL